MLKHEQKATVSTTTFAPSPITVSNTVVMSDGDDNIGENMACNIDPGSSNVTNDVRDDIESVVPTH